MTLLDEQMQDQGKERRTETRELRGEMDRRFDRVDQRFERIDQRFDRMDQRLDRLDQKIDRQLTWFVGMFVTLALGLVGLSLQISRLASI